MGDELIPISDEQAKLLQEALKTLRSVGGYLREVLGTVPEDLVGLLGGDWLKVRRAENVVVDCWLLPLTRTGQDKCG